LIAVPVDEGFIDYRAFLEALAAGGFHGTVAYEMCSPLRDGADLDVLDRYARRFVEFVAGVSAPLLSAMTESAGFLRNTE